MLCAKRKRDGQEVFARTELRSNGPFLCLQCGEEVVLHKGSFRIHHFAHKSPLQCSNGSGETDSHRRCKMEIYEALRQVPSVSDVQLERSLGTVRPDVIAKIRGVPVAIEVQISALSMETIIHRTKEYAQKGIYVLWLPQWTPYLDGERYSPRLWEKWIHAAYFGRVFYWLKGLKVVAYHFNPHFSRVPKSSWYSPKGKKMTGGGYNRKSKRFRAAVRGNILNLIYDFTPRDRLMWDGGGFKIPDAKLFSYPSNFPNRKCSD